MLAALMKRFKTASAPQVAVCIARRSSNAADIGVKGPLAEARACTACPHKLSKGTHVDPDMGPEVLDHDGMMM